MNKETREMNLAPRETTSIVLPEGLEEAYERMAERATSPGAYLKLKSNGFADANDQVLADKLVVVIRKADDYYYEWAPGENGLQCNRYEINDYADVEEARANGLSLGIELTLEIGYPEALAGETYRISLPEMSSTEFDRYAQALSRQGLNPSLVYTQLSIQIVRTKKGGPKPKVIFLNRGAIDQNRPIDVTPAVEKKKVASQTPDAWKA